MVTGELQQDRATQEVGPHGECLCAMCQTPITADTDTMICRSCHRRYHYACWQQADRCVTENCPGDVQMLPLYAGHDERATVPADESAPRRKRTLFLLAGAAVVLAALWYLAARLGFSHEKIELFAVIIAALGFDFVNGMNDSGNAIATVISTRVLTPLVALIMAAILNFVGAVVMEGIAKGIAGKIVDTHQFSTTPLMILCGLLGAITWAYCMARIGLPISMSHALIGGLVGAFLVAGAAHFLNLVFIGRIALWMILAPCLGFVGGWVLMVLIMWLFHRTPPMKINRQFRVWQVLSSALMAFSHGANDAQKAMGIITLALVAAHVQYVPAGHDPMIPLWVKIACATVIALGTGIGGRRVIGTLGHKIIKLAPVHGFAAETIAAGTIQLATALQVPISTTHVISSSILGVGSSKRLSAVRWGVASNIVLAWVFTIPTCGAAAAVLYGLVRLLHLH